jgi:hypothetical protein
MPFLIHILVALIVLSAVVWAVSRILAVILLPDPFKTIIWVIVVLIAVFAFLQMSGLYQFRL